MKTLDEQIEEATARCHNDIHNAELSKEWMRLQAETRRGCTGRADFDLKRYPDGRPNRDIAAYGPLASTTEESITMAEEIEQLASRLLKSIGLLNRRQLPLEGQVIAAKLGFLLRPMKGGDHGSFPVCPADASTLFPTHGALAEKWPMGQLYFCNCHPDSVVVDERVMLAAAWTIGVEQGWLGTFDIADATEASKWDAYYERRAFATLRAARLARALLMPRELVGRRTWTTEDIAGVMERFGLPYGDVLGAR